MLIHCSYHKCLTNYFQKVFNGLNDCDGYNYKHFKSLVNDFEEARHKYIICSINNHFIDIDSLPKEAKVSRFIRDPRDLVVSGYYYHKKGTEPWTQVKSPSKKDYLGVNGNIPSAMASDESFSEHLNRVSKEDGLIAQIDFRKNHFESMLKWPLHDKRILLSKYEEIVGNELAYFNKLFDFYELNSDIKEFLLKRVETFSASKMIQKSAHIRDPRHGQWRREFTPYVNDYFAERYSELLDYYDYSI